MAKDRYIVIDGTIHLALVPDKRGYRQSLTWPAAKKLAMRELREQQREIREAIAELKTTEEPK